VEIDPALVAVAGALSTVAGLLYRSLLHRAERAERAEVFWRDRALRQAGFTDLALDEAEKRSGSGP
jgi:hypothetical protein